MLSPSQLAAQAAWCATEHARIVAPDPTPTEGFAGAVGELAAALVHEPDAAERRRIANLLEAICAEASRLAAKRAEAA